jgi:DeoR/GlpR family transcriptional regulator of sugar metabolism
MLSISSPRTPGDRGRGLSHDRQAHIIASLSAGGSVTVAALASALAVSDMTIRRDLIELEREGRLRRVHGGAVAAGSLPPVAMDQEEPSFEARLRHRRPAKEAIAAVAAAIAAQHRTIALDVGTTTYLMAQGLRDLPHAKVFTNSVRIAAALDGAAGEVYLAGGRMRRDELSVGGPAAVAQFEALWFDVAVIGVSGVTSEGFFDYSLDDAEMKRVYLRRAGTRVVVCDAAKFQRMSLVAVASLADVNVLVTDEAPPERLSAALAAAHVEVRVAPPSRPS